MVSGRTAVWVKILDLPMLISICGVVTALVFVQLMSWSGALSGAVSVARHGNPPAPWVLDRERSLLCVLDSSMAASSDCAPPSLQSRELLVGTEDGRPHSP